MARPDTELTAAWLGIRKKKTAAAVIRVAIVITTSSCTVFLIFSTASRLLLCFSFLFPSGSTLLLRI